MSTRTIVWFRGKDLRISDHAPLRDAAEAGEVIPLFVLDPYFFAPVRARELPHRMQFLLDSLSALEAALTERGARQVWTAVENALDGTQAVRSFLNELVWREFTHSTLWDRPELLEKPFRPAFAGFPWQYDEELWQAWVVGKTGYPVVDAAARQLLGEGFVHNRARMVSASFLCKHLLIDYQRGKAHYMKYLTDGDWAQNNAGWQWSAGCGCDAQPYFRIFNPVTQGEKFDPEGHYVRRWVPELAKMPARYIHNPSEAPEAVLRAAGVRLEQNYPRPVVDHRFARERFLAVAAQHLKRDTRAGVASKNREVAAR